MNPDGVWAHPSRESMTRCLRNAGAWGGDVRIPYTSPSDTSAYARPLPLTRSCSLASTCAASGSASKGCSATA
jgi:hypothetical protein